MDFRTTVNIKKAPFQIDYKTNIFVMGSCFAQNIGFGLADLGFNVSVNPFGIQYNPISILHTLKRLMRAEEIKIDELFFHNELFHHFGFHGEFSRGNANDALVCMNSALKKGNKAITQTDFLIITFGTSFVYRLSANSSFTIEKVQENDYSNIVSNCHKLPSSQFHREKASLEFMIKEWKKFLVQYISQNPNVKILFTVSPIRHIADGLVENQLSKAQLILLVHSLCDNFQNVSYFPSYEILIDDLRDYRFYKADMTHPSDTAIEYIKEIFIDSYISKDCSEIIKKIKKLQLAKSHKPFNAEGKEYKRFILKNIEILHKLQNDHPGLHLTKLIEELKAKLK